MYKKIYLFLSAFIFLFISGIYSATISFEAHPISNKQLEILLTFSLEKDEWLYADSLNISVDNPSIALTAYKSSYNPINRYDQEFKKTKKVFDSDVIFTFNATADQLNNLEAYVHVRSITNKKGSEEQTFSLPFTPLQATEHNEHATPLEQKFIVCDVPHKTAAMVTDADQPFSLSCYISDLVSKTQSPLIQLILVFLLGILMSLTPCIYPMIPITIGILQAQGSKSLWYNFFTALMYTCGIATTFALFGLLASCTGPLCGQLLMQPFFIAALVILLAYLGLSMFGFYDIKMPKFMNSAKLQKKNGSLLSTFLMGAVSGTIASPCVSPGLALLLTLVATLGNKLLGFFLLFAFGIGLSTPLLVVGAFSSSLSLLPRAGMWMIEIKKLFGFIIFGMCFYYMSYVIAMQYLIWFIALFIAGTGVYFIVNSQRSAPSKFNTFNLLLGIILVALSVMVFFHALRINTYAKNHPQETDTIWLTNYDQAVTQAKSENKKLFLDFWATFCPVCLAINKKVLTKPALLEHLQKYFILVKVDGTYQSNSPYNELKNKYSIQGFPTFLIVDPVNETIEKKLGSELYDMSEQQIIDALHSVK